MIEKTTRYYEIDEFEKLLGIRPGEMADKFGLSRQHYNNCKRAGSDFHVAVSGGTASLERIKSRGEFEWTGKK